MKLITTIICGIFFISMISAIDLTAGECSTIEFPNTNNVNIEIIGNSFDMDGFNWSKNGTTIEYCFSLDYKPDNFTIRWFNDEEVYVEEPHQGGGGSRWSSSATKETNLIDEVINDSMDEVIKDEEVVEEVKEPIFKSKRSQYIFGSLIFLIIVGSFLFIMKLIAIKKSERRLKNNE